MKVRIFSCNGRRELAAMAGLALCLPAPMVGAQEIIEGTTSKNIAVSDQTQLIQYEQRSRVNYDTYILGPGDGLQIELLDLPELSGLFSIGPDGTLYLPRLRALYVEGLTVEELRIFLTQRYSTYVRDPQIYLRPVVYRPVRIYVGGEVKRPGFYTLSGETKISRLSESAERQLFQKGTGMNMYPGGGREVPDAANIGASGIGQSTFGAMFPTVFDAIRSAGGITPYSDLSQVEVIRKRPEGLGGGRIRTNLNFLLLITEGNDSQNIRLFDGDTLNVSKSPIVQKDQLLKAGQSNLNPQFMDIIVSGRVNIPGRVKLPEGSSLNQAISLAGGTKLLKGKVEFVRFNREGTITRRIFPYSPGAAANTNRNPVLAAGDIIRVNNSIISGSAEVLNELTGPFLSLYAISNLINGTSR